MSSHLSWRDLFSSGKWGECVQVLHKELKKGTKNNDEHSLRIIFENNKFVCEQLSKSWDCCQVEKSSSDWAKSYKDIIDLVHITFCQHICSELPLEVVLCVASNAMRWGVMKVDPLQQHSCCRESLQIAYSALKAVSKSQGVWNLNHRSAGLIETDFIEAISIIIPCLIKLNPTVCYLTVEIIVLGLLNWLDEEGHFDKPLGEFASTLSKLFDILPQIKFHLSDKRNSIGSNIVKFSWIDVGEFLSEVKLIAIAEIYVIVMALIYLRGRTVDKDLQALSYLKLLVPPNSEDSENFTALVHYMTALAYFREGSLEKSLYHIQKTSFCMSNIFLQSRLNLLKGQVLYLQNKSASALETLQAVEFKHKEVQIPLCAYLISKVYEKLGKEKQQCEVLDLLAEYLSTEQSVYPKLLSPLAAMEHRILLVLHVQPEISYDEVLKCSAKAHLSVHQPKEAAEKLMELLHFTSMNHDFLQENTYSWHLSELLHDTAAAFLEANCLYDAQQVCGAAIQFFSSKPEFGRSSPLAITCVEEDVIALFLLARAEESHGVGDVSAMLNRCAKLLQSLIDKYSETEDHKELVLMCRALLARVYLQKALVNIKRKFADDAVACFQRALHWKNDDPEVILYFMHTLLETEKFEESLALWEMYKEAKQYHHPQISSSIALNFLLGDQMPVEDREEVICRMQSLSLD
ncbi:putative phospholipid-transporting ATPase IM [Frankliniella fusca]|uniref:Phospholipid-transporting ATPase IM n=1 Tax=Frankliniella fusca TaxID=407009 RepID=A0AAE1I5P8_9NEOP|nr:putative phospholipid-transporting ATPase IM [Frankliniella fusca]